MNDSSLKPDKANHNKSVFSSLVGLKNTARAVLWQIEENRTRSEKPRSIDSHSNQIFTRELQLQKNQPAMDWLKSELEQIEIIRKAKGWNL